jgi:hypothetical protein
MAASGTTKKVSLNNLLACSPTATLASATITGDLTVRTNQLVVNSSGSFVGKSVGGVGVDGVQLLAGGFSGFSASATTALFVNRNTSDGTVLQLGRSGASAADLGAIAGGGLTVGLSGSEWMRVNSTGLGINVTPSAWGGAFKALQISRAGLRGSTATTGLSFNAYFDGTNFKYISAGLNALDYFQNSGKHVWQIAGVAVNANDPITFTEAMTLDVNGNLILLSSNTPATLTTNGQLTVNATSNTNLRFSYRGSDGTTRVANITLA